MGWIAVSKDHQILREGEQGRPVEAGNEGNLLFIMQEDYGHKVAIDLVNGVIILEYDDWGVQNGTVEIMNPKTVLYVCDETNIGADLFDIESSEPDVEGWYTNEFIPTTWRPIWFTRMTNGDPTKVIGVQATLPQAHGGRNIKKMVSLFSTGAMGID
jgi:hypothetical protein